MNAGIVLRGVDAGRSGAGGGFALHTFALTARGGEAVPGQLVGRFGDALAWAPAGELLPNTTYDVVLRAGAAGDSPYVEDAGLSEAYSFSFITGTESLPPVAFTGRLTVDIEVSEVDKHSAGCMSICGGVAPGCPSDGKVAVVIATVRVPPVSGGNEQVGYRGVVDYTAGVPSGLDGIEPRPPGDGLLDTSYFDMQVHRGAELQVLLTAGQPCFRALVSDSAGRSVTDSVCVPEVDVPQLLLERDAEIASRGERSPEAPATNLVALDGARAGEPSGCSVARAMGSGVSTLPGFVMHAGFGLLGLGLLSWFARSRPRDETAR